MRIGRVVDLDQQVNLSELKPLERIIVSAQAAYRNTDYYRRHCVETEEQREAARRKVLDAFIGKLMYTVAPFENSNLLEGKGDVAKAIVVEVPVKYKPFIEEAMQAHEFDGLKMQIVKASEVLEKQDIPCLLYIEKR